MLNGTPITRPRCFCYYVEITTGIVTQQKQDRIVVMTTSKIKKTKTDSVTDHKHEQFHCKQYDKKYERTF